MRDVALIFAHIGSVILMVGGTYVYAVEGWMAPFNPALYFCAFETVIICVVGLVWLVTTRKAVGKGIGADGHSAETLGFRRLTELSGQIALAFTALVILLTWAVPMVRSAVVQQIDERAILHEALGDPSDRVVAAACGRIVDRGITNSALILFEQLQKRPAAARQCLVTRTGLQGAPLLAQRLNARWMNELQTADHYAAGPRCASLESVGALADAFENPMTHEVSECALQAENELARACCSKLVADDFSLRPSHVNQHFPAMFNLAFNPATVEERQRAKRLGFHKPAVQRDLIALGCLHHGRVDNETYYASFLTFSERKSCDLTDAQKMAIVEEPQIAHFCEFFFEQEEQSVDINACHAFHAQTEASAISEAQKLVDVARVGYFRESDANFIQRGVVSAPKGGGAGPSTEEIAFLGLTAREGLGAKSWVDGPCQRTMFNDGSLTFTTQIGDCETYDPNAKIGDLVKEAEERRKRNNAIIQNPRRAKDLQSVRRRASRLVKNYRRGKR